LTKTKRNCSEKAHNLFHNKELKNKLAIIIIHFQYLLEILIKLDKYNITLRDSLLLIQNKFNN